MTSLPAEKKFPAKRKAAWVKALRSGRYKQGKNVLYNDSTGAYCCLGVLGRVMRVSRERLEGYGTLTFCVGRNLFPGPEDIETKLTQMNDNQGKSFAKIADWIEANL